MQNAYGRELTDEEIAAGVHRGQVGGLWEELGRLQLDFLIARGLTPDRRVLDVGCGCLRGGVELVRYLEPGNYYGLEVNASLLKAGRAELAAAGLAGKLPPGNLLHDGEFGAWRFGVPFGLAIAQSVFTHLPANLVRRCLIELARAVAPGGHFFATYFECPEEAPAALEVAHTPGGVTSYLDRDPYHYRCRDFLWLADALPWRVERVGDWGHPRGQRMLLFERR
jgi:SAM-dependent methyltransferase